MYIFKVYLSQILLYFLKKNTFTSAYIFSESSPPPKVRFFRTSSNDKNDYCIVIDFNLVYKLKYKNNIYFLKLCKFDNNKY